MANEEHLNVLRQGVDAWNAWRTRHPKTRPQLSNAGFIDEILSRANLSGADLREADLRESNLSGADLREADLFGANLSGTNLREADFTAANLSMADLFAANLIGADLSLANLCHVELHDTQFHNATMATTTLTACDLSSCQGVDTITHEDVSSIGVDTLERTLRGTGWTLTPSLRKFFLGAGLSADLLDYLPSLLGADPIQHYKCFISYAAADEPFPAQLYSALTGKKITCWKFDESAIWGRGVWANIDRAIQSYDKVVLVCSERSLQSRPVLREMERALQKEDYLQKQKLKNPNVDADVLFPIRIDDYVLDGWEHPRKADVVSKIIGDFRGWEADPAKYEGAIQRLVKALNPLSWPASAGPAKSPKY